MLSNILKRISGKIALSFSYQAEDIVALDLTLKANASDIEIFTLDTFKHFKECLEYHKTIESFYRVEIKKYEPNESRVSELESRLGEFGIRESLENRRECCRVRKVEPLERALRGKAAWITGLRAAQSPTRSALQTIEFDERRDLLKINPLALWSETDVFEYIKRNKLPINPLYNRGFKSVGCAPCTRAVKDGEGARAGRWWWENPEHKECGLHIRETA
jgi:phosphoadenosine phosphosulfate reductase